uniref:C2H2-type domain-containing protein n=1 Tax=Anopheles culicifacies TaxID=139723 RepID=A0A182MG99_9DIPT
MQIQTLTVKKSQQTNNVTAQQSQQRAIVAVTTGGAAQKTDQRVGPTIPRKAIPPRQTTSTPPKLAHAATAPKQTIVINGQKGSGGKSSSAAGRTGHVITSSNISNVSSLSSTSENRSVSDHDSSGNETAESEANRTAQSLVASQQMSAISAMSSKQDAVASDQQTKTSNGRPGERGANVSGRTGGDVSITTCNVCRKTFGRKEHLVQHLKSHIGLRPFKCDAPECNKTFSRKEHLIRHTVSHTGQKMFICDKCQKPFSRKDNLNKHRKTHTDQANVSPYSCNVCNKDFSSKNQFLKHKDSCFEEETDPPKPTIKKQPVTTVKTEPKQQAGNTITVLESTIVSKSSQPPPLAHAPLTSVVTSDPPQPTTVVQSLPLTITANHVPTNSATIQLPIQPQVHQLIQQQQQQPQHQNGTNTQQQIFTIPAHMPNGKTMLQITLPNNVSGQSLATSSSASNSGTVQTITNAQSATLASLGAGRATIINPMDGSTMFLPTNIIFDTSQIIATSHQS